MSEPKTRPDLLKLLAESKARMEAMSPEELQSMFAAQRESFARSIRDWPKPKYRFENGVKVYASYEDYCND